MFAASDPAAEDAGTAAATASWPGGIPAGLASTWTAETLYCGSVKPEVSSMVPAPGPADDGSEPVWWWEITRNQVTAKVAV